MDPRQRVDDHTANVRPHQGYQLQEPGTLHRPMVTPSPLHGPLEFPIAPDDRLQAQPTVRCCRFLSVSQVYLAPPKCSRRAKM